MLITFSEPWNFNQLTLGLAWWLRAGPLSKENVQIQVKMKTTTGQGRAGHRGAIPQGWEGQVLPNPLLHAPGPGRLLIPEASLPDDSRRCECTHEGLGVPKSRMYLLLQPHLADDDGHHVHLDDQQRAAEQEGGEYLAVHQLQAGGWHLGGYDLPLPALWDCSSVARTSLSRDCFCFNPNLHVLLARGPCSPR